MRIKVLIVLQNAWRHNAAEGEIGWSADPNPRRRAHWERALWASQTGKRLRAMLPVNAHVRVINASPRVGNTPASVFAIDTEYVTGEASAFAPDVTVLCGRVAEQLRPYLAGRILTTPHPAWRLFSRDMAEKMRHAIEEVGIA